MIATTSEQSDRLLHCGVSADTADMVWTRFESDGEKYEQLSVMDESAYEVASLSPIPAWSLSALMTKILPHDIFDNEIDYSLFLQRRRSADNTPTWELSYYNLEYDATLLFVEIADPIGACVLMAEKLVANGYKLNEQ